MPAAPSRSLGHGLGELAAGVGRVDLLVDDTDLDGGVHPAGDALVLLGQLLVQGLALVIGSGGELALVQDATAALAPITATSASGQANTFVAPSEREFIAM